MRKWVSLAILAALLAALGFLVRDHMGLLGRPPSVFKGRYATEEQWLVGEIARDIAEMALYAAGRPIESLSFRIEAPSRPAADNARISLGWGDGPPLAQDLTLQHFVWSPDNYRGYASAVIGALGLHGSPGSPGDESLLAALLNLQARVIETQNQRVSSLLSRAMLDPTAHEHAALVVAALVMRDDAGTFSDTRQLLCRMTAHLAFAGALRTSQSASLSGGYAEVVLLTNAGRTADAMTALDRLRDAAGPSEVQRRWVTALKMEITSDWRALGAPEHASLLERLQYFRALATSMNTDLAARFHEDHEAEDVTDWGRIIMQAGAGANAGGEFAGWAIELELAEAGDVWERVHSRRATREGLVAALDEPPERCLTARGPRALGWGSWAAYLQRLLCHQIVNANRYVRAMQGLKDDADAEAARNDAEFGRLRLYPMVRIERTAHAEGTIESIRDALGSAIETMIHTPELVPPDSWQWVLASARYAPLWTGPPDQDVWYTHEPRFLVRWASHWSWRTGLKGARQDVAFREALREADPYHYWLTWKILESRHGDKLTLAQMEQELAGFSGYNLGALWTLANVAEKDPAQYRGVLRRICDLWADGCLYLGYQLVQDGLYSEAAQAYEKAIEKAIDRVWVSNRVQWLMHYYYDKRRFDRAKAVASMAADVYSGNGLATLGEFLEREGKLKEAEEYFGKVRDRYDDDSELLGFYFRRVHVHDDPSYAARLEPLLAKVFVDGLAKLDRSQLPATPTHGAAIQGTHASLQRLGLGRGDIVVGFDGWRVRTREQYEAIREFSSGTEMKLYVWSRGRYVEVDARVPDRDLTSVETVGS